jgi:hypothetical protein
MREINTNGSGINKLYVNKSLRKKLNLSRVARTNENPHIDTSIKKITHRGIALECGNNVLRRFII